MEPLLFELEGNPKPKAKEGIRRYTWLIVIIAVILATVIVAGVVALVLVLVFVVARTTHSDSFSVSGELPASSRRGVSGNVDYLYAVNACPSLYYDDENRILAEVGSNGKFNVTLSKDYPWILVFIDSSQVGVDMIKYTFLAKEINTVYGMSNCSSHIHLGKLVVNGNKAKLKVDAYEDYITKLGLTVDSADYLATIDSTTLRYSNPDVDGDGILDLEQTDLPEHINIWIWVHYVYGTLSTNYLTDYVKQKKEVPYDDIALHFVYTGPELSFSEIEDGLKDVYMTAPEKWTLHWTDNGDLDPVDHAEYNSTFDGGDGHNPYGTMIFDYIDHPDMNSHINFKITFDHSISNPPEGTYTYRFFSDEASSSADETLTFPFVNLPEDTQSTDGFVFPFPVFRTNSEGVIRGYDYKWKSYDKENEKFIDATKDELELKLGRNEAQIKWCNDIGTIDGCDEINVHPYRLHYVLDSFVDMDENHNANNILLEELVQVQISYTTISGMTIKIMIEDNDGNTHMFFPQGE